MKLIARFIRFLVTHPEVVSAIVDATEKVAEAKAKK